MNVSRLAGALWLIWSASGAPVAADWNEWRGPQRNGVVQASPPLLDAWGEEGPKRVWLSEDIVPSGDTEKAGGLGSVVVADGRVYCLAILARREKLTTRTLSEDNLIKLGWTAKKPPAELLASAEKARLSAERRALKTPAEVQAWLRKWMEANLTAAQRKEFGAFIGGRLRQGEAARDLALLEKLAAIKDKPFPDQEALDAWFSDNGIEGDLRKSLQPQFPSTETFRDSGVFCLDAATGKTLWKKVFPGGPLLPLYGNHPASSTPCIAGGKCYVIGTDGAVFCLDAKTGNTVWTGMAGDGRVQKHCSFIVADGIAVIPAGPLTGFDAETGNVLWTHESVPATWASPVRWPSGGTTYVVVRAGGKILCLAPKSGSILWSLNEGKLNEIYAGSTPAIEGDRMAVGRQSGVRLYKLSAEKAELLWDVKCPMDYCSSPTIYKGHAYVFGRKAATCISLDGGEVAWQDEQINTGSYHSPILADGKFFLQGYDKKRSSSFGDGSLVMVAASAEKGRVPAQAKIRQALCTTPAVVGGRIFCRLVSRVACYDLRK